jgi:hypothetical protein
MKNEYWVQRGERGQVWMRVSKKKRTGGQRQESSEKEEVKREGDMIGLGLQMVMAES